MRTERSIDWKRLCALIDDDPQIVVDVAKAKPRDKWGALIDGLDDAGALAYLDVEDTGIEVAEALAEVPRVLRLGVDLDTVGDIDGLDDAVRAVEQVLAPHALRIVYLPEDADAFPLVVVPADNVEEILALAKASGHEARSFAAHS